MGRHIELTTSDGFTLGAYRAEPAGTPRAGMVLLQELFGVNRHIRSVADRFAGEGYLVVAPALFDRAERDLELGYAPEDLKRAQALRTQLKIEDTMADVQAAIDAASEGGKVVVVGYCWGGLLAFLAAAKLSGLTAGVCYYGGRIAHNLDEAPKVPLLLHFGEQDPHIPAEDVAKIRAAYPELEVYTYPANHAFNCDERPSYDKASADLALSRTLAFLDRQLG